MNRRVARDFRAAMKRSDDGIPVSFRFARSPCSPVRRDALPPLSSACCGHAGWPDDLAGGPAACACAAARPGVAGAFERTRRGRGLRADMSEAAGCAGPPGLLPDRSDGPAPSRNVARSAPSQPSPELRVGGPSDAIPFAPWRDRGGSLRTVRTDSTGMPRYRREGRQRRRRSGIRRPSDRSGSRQGTFGPPRSGPHWRRALPGGCGSDWT